MLISFFFFCSYLVCAGDKQQHRGGVELEILLKELQHAIIKAIFAELAMTKKPVLPMLWCIAFIGALALA